MDRRERNVSSVNQMVNIFTIFGVVMLSCWAAARYGRRPAGYLVKFVGWSSGVKKWPVLLLIFAMMMLQSNEADAGVGEFVGGLIGAVGDELTDVVSGMFEAVRAAILKAFEDLICLLIEHFGAAIKTIMLAIPGEVSIAMQSAKPYMDIANSWLPVDVGMVWFAAYLVFLLVQIPLKLIIKIFVPTVG